MFGVGTPELVNVCHPQEKRPGVWRCSFDPISLPGLPAVWSGGPWLVTPILQSLRSTGHDVHVYEGYVWNESHGIFKRRAETLWNVRQGFRLGSYKEQTWKSEQVRVLAEDASKQIATATIGLTSSSLLNKPDVLGCFKPEWSLPVTEELRLTLNSNLTIVEKLQMFNRMIKEGKGTKYGSGKEL